MNEQEKKTHRLPKRILLLYWGLGVLVCTLLGIFYAWQTDWSRLPDADVLWSLASMLMFFGLALGFAFRTTKRLYLYEDRLVRKNFFGERVTYFKDISGHHEDDSSSNSLANNARGYFRGIIIKEKNGNYFSLYRAELSDFPEVAQHLKHRCRRYTGHSIRKLLAKEDRKLLLLTVLVFAVVIMSLMH